MSVKEKIFYIDFDAVMMCYPYKVDRRVEDFGVLEQYRNKKYNLEEINKIIAELIIKTPYVSHSMFVKLYIKSKLGFHYVLDIKNYEYKNQEPMDKTKIEFLYA